MKSGIIATALAAISFAGVASAAGLAGTWQITGDIVGNAVNPTCDFKDAGGKLTASCLGGDATDVKVEGKNVSWEWNPGPALLAFKGTLDTDTSMKGPIDVNGAPGVGNFTAVKK